MNRTLFLSLVMLAVASAGNREQGANPPIYIAFLWHMHQPIYYPGKSIVETDQLGYFPFSVADIHNQRIGPYTSWPKNAVQKGASLGNFGAQVSFSGSLIENLNTLEAAGNGNFANWKTSWIQSRAMSTNLGNPRLDLIGFGYYHPLMGLLQTDDIRKQVARHRQAIISTFGGPASKGIFPPENAFSPRMIPALAAEGIEWVLVDNIHFERTTVGYPFNTGGNIYEPNKADIRNPNPNDWIQLNGVWAPTKVSAGWARQPHYVQYIDPATGAKSRIIAVPADRYLGNEDGRGGFGALNYESVISQFESYNTDPAQPILIVLHHDGDNYGGGTDSYYGSNFQNFVSWVTANPSRFVCTTVQDYLQMFPPDTANVIHVEDGSWSGADNGDPEFKKWLGDPDGAGYSPDRNSWGVLTAAKNYVAMAEQVNASAAEPARNSLMVSQASDYWYWDGSIGGKWDVQPTRGANLAISASQLIIAGQTDLTPPTIFAPQRNPYNPGATEWNIVQSSTMSVWTYVFDVSGVQTVTLKYRADNDGVVDVGRADNFTYAGGGGVGSWINLPMTGTIKSSATDPAPLAKAQEFNAQISGVVSSLIDYYVEATDTKGNVARSPIAHVWIGPHTAGGGGGGEYSVSWKPANPTKSDSIQILVKGSGKTGKLHWGVNDEGNTWQTPHAAYRPTGTVLYNIAGPAVETPLVPADTQTIAITIGPFNDVAQMVDRVAFVIHFDDNTWDNNGGQDYHIDFGGGGVGTVFVMDGVLDSSARLVASNDGLTLHAGWNGLQLYVATQSGSSQGADMFIFVSDTPRVVRTSQWGKGGSVSAWSAFLGNESTNNWSGWTDHKGNAASKAVMVLEGTINLQQHFGALPPKIYLAVGKYQTQDGGTLIGQVPTGNANGDLEPGEMAPYEFGVSDVQSESRRPEHTMLGQNFPNPFNPATAVSYQLSTVSDVSLRVFDLLGREVAVLVNERKPAGMYAVTWDAADRPSGVYFYRLAAGGLVQSRRMILMR